MPHIWEDVDQLYFILIPLTVFLVIAIIFGILGVSKKITTRELTITAVCIALSFALSYIKFEMPQGGSITLASCLPLALYCYYFGFKKALFAGFAYSLLQLVQGAYVVHPLQLFLDYIFAFTSISLVALAPKKNTYGIVIGIAFYAIARYFFSTLSGVVFFAEYAEGMNPLIYSLGYNSILLIDCAIAAFIAAILTTKSVNKYFKNLANDILQSAKKRKTDAEKLPSNETKNMPETKQAAGTDIDKSGS